MSDKYKSKYKEKKQRNLIAKELFTNGLFKHKVVEDKKKLRKDKSDWKKEIERELNENSSKY